MFPRLANAVKSALQIRLLSQEPLAPPDKVCAVALEIALMHEARMEGPWKPETQCAESSGRTHGYLHGRHLIPRLLAWKLL
jgi:hypothetical protein